MTTTPATTTSIHLASRLDPIQQSLTLSLDDRVRRLKAEGRDIVNLTVGQPDFDTPAWIGEAARVAIAAGRLWVPSCALMVSWAVRQSGSASEARAVSCNKPARAS